MPHAFIKLELLVLAPGLGIKFLVGREGRREGGREGGKEGKRSTDVSHMPS
jgi:hypothetical protein